MGRVIHRRIGALVIVAVGLSTGPVGCTWGRPGPGSTTTSLPTTTTTTTVRPCPGATATARIVAREPGNFWMVTDLAGTVSNVLGEAIHVSSLYLEFEPGIPPGVHTAELTVPVDLTIAADGTASWDWHGSLLVRPFHDDAPAPVVKRVDCGPT